MTYVKGQWKAVCDRCGFDFLSRQLAQEWTGLRVCRGPGTNDCFDRRHPQESLRAKADRQSPPWARPPGDEDENNTTTADDL